MTLISSEAVSHVNKRNHCSLQSAVAPTYDNPKGTQSSYGNSAVDRQYIFYCYFVGLTDTTLSMKLYVWSLLLPLVSCHSNNRFKSSNYKLTSDWPVRYFDSVGGCASHCVLNSKISPLTLIISLKHFSSRLRSLHNKIPCRGVCCKT